MPPFYIFPGTRRDAAWMNGCYKGSVCAMSVKAYINTYLFNQYIDFFISTIGPQRPVLLIMDGHRSHFPIHTIRKCKDAGIDVFSLPAHTSHFTQPLDRTVFVTFKSKLEKELDLFYSEHGYLPKRVSNFYFISNLTFVS